MKPDYRLRRLILAMAAVASVCGILIAHPDLYQTKPPVEAPDVTAPTVDVVPEPAAPGSALEALEKLAVKGRAAKTDYSRRQFGNGWMNLAGCDMRNIILNRDLQDVVVNEKCQVVSGRLTDPYTGKEIAFVRGETSSQAVQIDHVVALSNAWQTGAQQLSFEEREQLANDPLELLAVDGEANQNKSAGDAATWLPPNKAFRCQYVARQIAVKSKYLLWVTLAEKNAMASVLTSCPRQSLP